ncbi:MAG: hypothetical protein ACLPTJ_21715, partial [Solirubrobacteraceae bacterium]
MRAPVDHIPAPPFPARARWINVATLRMDQQLGRPVLVEFWDFCRPNSIRTLPYMKAWHKRYERDGLRVVGVRRRRGGDLPHLCAEQSAAAGPSGISEGAVTTNASFRIGATRLRSLSE